MSSFVTGPERLREIEAVVGGGQCSGREGRVDFTTTLAFARSALPEIFKPVPLSESGGCAGRLWVAEVQAPFGSFNMAAIRILCEYESRLGWWTLSDIRSSEAAVFLGRDVEGAPSKEGLASIRQSHDRVQLLVERRSQWLVNCDIALDDRDMAAVPSTVNDTVFDVKVFLSYKKGPVEALWPPRLNVWAHDTTLTSVRSGRATLRFGQSEWDPVQTIPLMSVGDALVADVEVSRSLVTQIDISNDETPNLARAVWGRAYDNPMKFPIARRWQDS